MTPRKQSQAKLPSLAQRQAQLGTLVMDFEQEVEAASPNRAKQCAALAECYRYLLSMCVAEKAIDDNVLLLTSMLGRAFLVVDNIKRREEHLVSFDGYEDQSTRVMRATAGFVKACNRSGWWKRGEMEDNLHLCFTRLEIEVERFAELELLALSARQSILGSLEWQMDTLGRSAGAPWVSSSGTHKSSLESTPVAYAPSAIRNSSSIGLGKATETYNFVEEQRRAATTNERDQRSLSTDLDLPIVAESQPKTGKKEDPCQSSDADQAKVFFKQDDEDDEAFLLRVRPTAVLQEAGDRVCVPPPRSSTCRDTGDMRLFLQEGQAILDACEDTEYNTENEEDNGHHQTPRRSNRPDDGNKLLAAAIQRSARRHRIREGRWMIFVKGEAIDCACALVFRAVMEGRVGGKAEVKLIDPEEGQYILYVSTPDFGLHDCVMKVCSAIRRLDWTDTTVSAGHVDPQMSYKPLAYSALKIWSENRYGVKPYLHTRPGPTQATR